MRCVSSVEAVKQNTPAVYLFIFTHKIAFENCSPPPVAFRLALKSHTDFLTFLFKMS